MIKMADFFQSRRKLIPVVGVLCLLILGGALLTSGINKPDPASGSTTLYDAKTLIEFKTDYVGDNSKVVNLISQLPLANFRKELSLQTGSSPYGITVNYDFIYAAINQAELKMTLRNNTAVIFALIKNADIITYNVRMPRASEQSFFEYSRMQIQKDFPRDLREYAQNPAEFEQLLKNITFKIFVAPKQYTAAMSSTPGIRISAQYDGTASKVRYSAERGVLFTWDTATGKMSKGSRSVELPYGDAVYWSPLEGNRQISSDVKINLDILDEKGRKLDNKQILITHNDSLYTVSPSSSIVYGSQTPSSKLATDLNEAVSRAIKSREYGYLDGETSTEGHIILDSEEQNGIVKVYTIASFGYFGFENGIFTKVSGSGGIPSVMTFSKNPKGQYSLLDYKEAEDGANYPSSIKKLFPIRLHAKVFAANEDYPKLIKQQEEQAREYLKSIGRSAKVSGAHVDKKLMDINSEASNKLLTEYTKYDAFLNACPYWIGTRECIENGERFIYETSQSKSSDGCDLITFKKSKENGTVIKVKQYKIQGSVIRSHPQFN